MGRSFNTMTRRVETLLRGQRRLMAAVSHELRTPLARMRLELEMLRDQGAEEARLAELEHDIAEVDALVGEILESARLDQGVLALRIEPLEALPLVEDAVGLAGIEGREIRLDIPTDLPTFEGDRARLLRVLVNLLVNADRYTPPTAGIQVRVREASLGKGVRDALHFAVEDEGPGVPEEALASLFEPFFRVEQSRSRATGGLGLGLMLVRQIVEAHAGKVGARNRAEGGLEVSFLLPKRGRSGTNPG
jgi:signal transduction histidine kinase